MAKYKTLYVSDRDEWRRWLEKNGDKKTVSGLSSTKNTPENVPCPIPMLLRKHYVSDGSWMQSRKKPGLK